MSAERPIGVGMRRPPQTPRPGPTTRVRRVVVGPESARRKEDLVATEEPCEIRVRYRDTDHVITVTMRTPGNDFELAVGFLYAEGMIGARADIKTVSYCASGPPEQLYNIVTVELTDDAEFVPAVRNFLTTSACGVCGTSSLEQLNARGATALDDGARVTPSVITALPTTLRARQTLFAQTGGVHAAGLFDTTGTPLLVREDVGRHNAVDKVVGALMLAGELPARGRVLQVSGRASFEILQKALAAEIPIVCAVGAPSSLAVSLAERFGVTLAGFMQGEQFNVYATPDRVLIA